MKITTIGKGNIGGGLARLFERAGHDVTTLGHEGGDASDADVVIVAVPGGAITEALGRVNGIDGQDRDRRDQRIRGAQRVVPLARARGEGGDRRAGREGLQRQLRALYDQVAEQRTDAELPYAADDEAREVTEQLIRDAGYDPVSVGGLENARALEDFVPGLLGKIGRVFYRFAPPGEL